MLLYGLGRAVHGSWGQIGVQADALRGFYIQGVFCLHLHSSLKVFALPSPIQPSEKPPSGHQAGCTPSSVTPVTESSFATFIDVANSWPPLKPRATSYTTTDLPGTLLTLWRVFSTAERLTVPSTARVALAKSAQVPHSAESLLRGGQ